MKKQAVLLPGTVLKETFLDTYQITVAKLAEDIGLSPSAIRQIVNNKAKVSPHIALRLSKYFGTDVSYWVNLQNAHDIAELDKDEKLVEAVKNIVKAKKPAPSKQAVVKPTRAKKGAAAAADTITSSKRRQTKKAAGN
ncbi:MAG: HigA family addiction module antidote protein [Treponema sp.]|jgi:addiction module HigA family antidote|nr:HigA family addiction module antidote protein [Treponema sp.]